MVVSAAIVFRRSTDWKIDQKRFFAL